jgi:hypothetical protein
MDSFHHYLTGEEGVVEIESHWTATRRENQGIYPTIQQPIQPKSPALRFAIGRATPPFEESA